MLFLRSDEISSLAAQTIQKYREYIGVDWELFKVNPITLAEMWGLDVKFVDLGEDSDIMGFTAFNDMDITLTDAILSRMRSPIILSTSFAAPIILSSSDCSRILKKPIIAILLIMMSTWRISLRRRC